MKCSNGAHLDINDPEQTYKDIKEQIAEEQLRKLREYLTALLDFCEEIALGIRHNIYDFDVAYDYFGYLAPRIYKWAELFAQEIREKCKDNTIYLEIEQLTEKMARKRQSGKGQGSRSPAVRIKRAIINGVANA